MQDISLYCLYLSEFRKRWVEFITSSLCAAGTFIWGAVTQEPLAWWFTGFFVVLAFVMAGYGAWKEKHDELTRIKNREHKAAVLSGVLEAANVFWMRGTLCGNDEAAEQWGVDYLAWSQESKDLIERELSRSERVAIFQIGNTSDIPLKIGATLWQQAHMGFLDHHMGELRKALERYL